MELEESSFVYGLLEKSSPQHSFRFSDQTWLRQDRTADHVLRRLHGR